MTDMARQLLQELMGEYDNNSKDFTDRDVCKDHLVDFCPNQQFTNTKADLGPCNLVHDDKLKEAYQKSADCGRLGYELAFYERLQRLTYDLQRKVRRAHERLTAEADEQLTNPHKEEKEEKAIILDVRIKQMMEQVQELGEMGRVHEAFTAYKQADKIKDDLESLRERINAINPMFKNEKRLEVCDVCGAFLVPNDASKRLDAHNEGKQHQGYMRIRKALEEHRQRFGDSGRKHYNDRDSEYRHRSRSPNHHHYHHHRSRSRENSYHNHRRRRRH